MNAATAKQTIKQHFQTLTDEQLQQYHMTHDYFTGRPLAEPMKPRGVDKATDRISKKRQSHLNSLNDVLYPTPTLGSILGDSLAALKVSAVSSAAEVVELASEKLSEDLVKRAKAWFDTYQADGVEALLSDQSLLLNDANLAVLKRGFSRNTILIQNACMLSTFWIRSPLDWDEQGDLSLLEHLFVEYQAPAFLKSCWSRVADEVNTQWLLCFILFSQGGSLKALANHFGWKVASNKMWHQLFSCPSGMQPKQAVLYAEFKRMGGWEADFTSLMSNEAYVIDLLMPVLDTNRDFWYDTCRWVISKQFDLSDVDNRKVLSWARHQFTEFARRGERYSLQGRSLNKVLESIAEYEQELAEIARVRARLAERARQVSMARNEERDRLREQERQLRQEIMARRNAQYSYNDLVDLAWNPRGWDWIVTVQGKKWIFRELTNSQALRIEGEAMDHCVDGYSRNCFEGESVIFSLKCEGFRKATIEVDPLTRDVVQLSGRCNAEIKKPLLIVIKKWMKDVVHGHCYW